MAYEPTLTETNSPSPRVRVDFNTLAGGTASATVYRTWEGLTAPLRDAQKKYAVGGLTVTDYETPNGIEVAYYAEMFNAVGVSLGTTGLSESVIYGEPGWLWISDPLDPTRAVFVQQASTFLQGGITRPRPAERYAIEDRTVVLYGERQLIRGARLDCFTSSEEQTTMLDQILGAGLVLFRTSPGVELPRLLYGYVQAPTRTPFDHAQGGEYTKWGITVDEVTAPTLSSGVFAGTWNLVKANFATWDDLKAAYATWLDLKKNPPGV